MFATNAVEREIKMKKPLFVSVTIVLALLIIQGCSPEEQTQIETQVTQASQPAVIAVQTESPPIQTPAAQAGQTAVVEETRISEAEAVRLQETVEAPPATETAHLIPFKETKTPPYDDCVARSSQTTSEPSDDLSILEEGFVSVFSSCDAEEGLITYSIVIFGGKDGSILEPPNYEVDASGDMGFAFTPSFTGDLRIDSTLIVNSSTGAAAGSATALLEFRDVILVFVLPPILDAFLETAEALIFQTASGVRTDAYVSADLGDSQEEETYLIGDHGFVGSFPIPPNSQSEEFVSENVTVSLTVPVQQGQTIHITTGSRTTAHVHGWAVAYWNPLGQQETFVTSVTLIEQRRVEAVATDDGKVYLGDLLLLDTETDAPGCFGVGEISYSPTYEHFLVVMACFEGDNDAFLFRSDGSDRRQITEEWDYINYFNYEWSSDGESFVYERINSCCADPPPNAPPAGLVHYDVQSGEKTLLSPPTPTPTLYRVVNVQNDDVLNVRSGPGVDNPVVGVIPPNGTDIQITGDGVQVGTSLWVPIQYQNITGWVNKSFLIEQSGALPPISSTQIIAFYPTGIRGEESSGNCWTSSIVLARSDAWRCATSESIIHDPCFSIAEDNTAVICDASPLGDGQGFKLNLTEPLPEPFQGNQEGNWWILELADGTICTQIQGTGIQIGDEFFHVTCGGWFLSNISITEEIWIAELVRSSGDSSSLESTQMHVKNVWR